MFGRDREVCEEDSEFACYSMHIAGIKAKARAESTYFFVQNCLKEGLPIPLISELTGLCEEEINKILK
jgi:hypothetical protein